MITPRSSDSECDHGFQIAPMVDVVFVLLLFFMALAGLRQIEHRIDQKLPEGGIASGQVPLIVDISSGGVARCNGLEFALNGESDTAKLRAWLANVQKSDAETPVIIRPEDNAEHALFIDVLASVKSAGFARVSFR